MTASVTVVIPLFNASGTIVRAIDSALAQASSSIEILVIDDCSTDDSRAVVEAYYAKDDRVRLIAQDRNGGPSAARNRGFAEATGEWIALLDADDAWRPGRLAALSPMFADNDLVADNIVSFDAGADQETGLLYAEPIVGEVSFEQAARKLRDGRPLDYGFLKPLFRASFLRQHDIVYDGSVRQGEDWLLYLECLGRGARFALSPSAGYVYTTWMGEISRVRSPSTHTRPDGHALAAAMERMSARLGEALRPADRATLGDVVAEVRASHGAWRFYDAVSRRDWPTILSSLASSSARRAAGRMVSDKLARMRGAAR